MELDVAEFLGELRKKRSRSTREKYLVQVDKFDTRGNQWWERLMERCQEGGLCWLFWVWGNCWSIGPAFGKKSWTKTHQHLGNCP